MNKPPIKHLWFDFSETLAFIKHERSNQLRYETYARLTNKPLNAELISEVETLYETFNHSNAAIFRHLGQTAGFWSEQINTLPPSELYELADKNLAEILYRLREIVPISIFSNMRLNTILPALGIDPAWFTHNPQFKHAH